jgi:MerR family mercuric resistance operon transcriptional regulator
VRRYGLGEVNRLRFIKRAQSLGSSLEEVKVLLELSVGEHCAETQQALASIAAPRAQGPVC